MNKNYLSTHLPSFKIYTFKETESTNSFAKSLQDDYALVTTLSQTKGRGRLGREFVSPPLSGIYMSLVVKIDDLYQNIPFITTAAAVGVHKAITAVTGVEVSIKWVNDIYKKNKKVSGILCEIIDNERAVIGIGINLFPNNLPEIATSLFEKEVPFNKEELVVEITKNIVSILSSLPDTSFLEYYKAHSCVLGKSVECILPNETFFAKAVDINSSGALVVRNETGIRELSSGEISIRFTD